MPFQVVFKVHRKFLCSLSKLFQQRCKSSCDLVTVGEAKAPEARFFELNDAENVQVATYMGDFRHNLSPVEVTIFLKSITELTEDLLIRFCYKVPARCPECGHRELCRSGAVSFYSSSFDKLTHEITICLQCEYKELNTLLTCERL